jgi:hypothetical protein
MAGTSVGGISADLGEALSRLQLAGSSLANAHVLAEEFLRACLALGVEGTADSVERLCDQMGELADQLDAGQSRVGEILAQVEALRGDGTGVGGQRGAEGKAGAGADRPMFTQPSRAPDASAVPDGEPETVLPSDSSVMQNSIRIQNRSAEIIAAAGYRIRQLPKSADSVSPDFEIEGRIFDCYAPAPNTSKDSIRNKIRAKIRREQARRFVVNLERSQVSVEELRQHLTRTAPSGLQEVLVIKHGAVVRAWP